MQRKLIILLLICSAYALAALPATTTTWEVRPTNGSDNAGGCFIAGSSGTDRSQGTIFTAFTDLVIGGTTTQVTSVAHPFGATDVGNCIQIISGSGCTTGVFQVVSVASVTATLDRSAGTAASTCTANLGGALQTITKLLTFIGNSNIAWIKAESTITTSTGFTVAYGTNNGVAGQFNGYTSTRGDNGKVTIQATAGSLTLWFDNGPNSIVFRNFILDSNSQTNSRGFRATGQFITVIDVTATNSTTGDFTFDSAFNTCLRCLSNGGTGFGYSMVGGSTCIYCGAVNHNNSTGFSLTGTLCFGCYAANNTGTGAIGFSLLTGGNSFDLLMNSVACGNASDGIRYAGGTFGQQNSPIVMNNISTGNSGYGFNFNGGAAVAGTFVADYNAYFNNTLGALNNVTAGSHDVTMTATPFNCAGTDFTLNNTAGAGAAIRTAGYPGALPAGGTGFAPIGLLVPAAAAAGGTSAFVQ